MKIMDASLSNFHGNVRLTASINTRFMIRVGEIKMKLWKYMLVFVLFSCSSKQNDEIVKETIKKENNIAQIIQPTSNSTQELNEIVTGLAKYYKLDDPNETRRDDRIHEYEDKRTYLQEYMLVGLRGNAAIEKIKERYGLPLSIEKKEIANIQNKEQTDVIEIYKYARITYGIYKIKNNAQNCMIMYCRIDNDVIDEYYQTLFKMTKEEIEIQYGVSRFDGLDFLLLSPFNNGIEYGIKAYIKAGKIDYLEFTLLL